MSDGYWMPSRMGLTLGPEYGGPLSVAMCRDDAGAASTLLFPFRTVLANDDGTKADAYFVW